MTSSRIQVVRLAHVHYQHPDLRNALAFFADFGLVQEKQWNNKVFLRGYGVQPYLQIAEQSPDGQRNFQGGYWVVRSREDLVRAASLPGATPIHDLESPGGGQVVTIQDPNGMTVGFVHGQALRKEDQMIGRLEHESSGIVSNTASDKPRKGSFRRFEVGASPVHKLGHYGYVVPAKNFEETLRWYSSVINLKPTDAVFNPNTGKDETCFMHIDLGARYTDHHSFFLTSSPAVPRAHVHHSSFEVNDMDTQVLGHDYLRKKGWTNCWGIGRHVLGSQIFDYWFDGSGNIVEHYSDGDLVNEDTPFGREPAAPDTLYVWGPNIPLAFVTGKVEDAGKPLPMPPDVVTSAPAQI